jgi:hypothetical protein
MVMDMDVFAEGNSEPVTRVPSPTQVTTVNEDKEENGDAFAVVKNGEQDIKKEERAKEIIQMEPEIPDQPKKMGNLMKELKQDVQQGAMEFDMSSFF